MQNLEWQKNLAYNLHKKTETQTNKLPDRRSLLIVGGEFVAPGLQRDHQQRVHQLREDMRDPKKTGTHHRVHIVFRISVRGKPDYEQKTRAYY